MRKRTNKKISFKVPKAKVAIIAAEFNQAVTKGLLAGCLKAFQAAQVKKENIKIVWVPGSFEIPLIAQKLAVSNKYDALVCLGAIIKGQTAHFEYIALGLIYGLQRVILDHDIPIGFGVLTCYNLKQAQARAKNDRHNKGYEAAQAVLSLVKLKI